MENIGSHGRFLHRVRAMSYDDTVHGAVVKHFVNSGENTVNIGEREIRRVQHAELTNLQLQHALWKTLRDRGDELRARDGRGQRTAAIRGAGDGAAGGDDNDSARGGSARRGRASRGMILSRHVHHLTQAMIWPCVGLWKA